MTLLMCDQENIEKGIQKGIQQAVNSNQLYYTVKKKYLTHPQTYSMISKVPVKSCCLVI